MLARAEVAAAPRIHRDLTRIAAVDSNTGEKGQRESLGARVNYLYDLRAIEANQAAFTAWGRVAASRVVRDLAAQGHGLEGPRPARRSDTKKQQVG